MKNKEKLADIQYLINEFYSTEEDRDGLSESAKSRKIFNQYCKDIFRDLEVLNIIKHKRVNLDGFVRTYSAKEYNDYYTLEEANELTQDEFNKIKEWLENE